MAKAVIFDLDGTLVDSAPEIQDSVNRVWMARGYAPFDLPTVISFVGKGLPNLIRLAMASRGVDDAEYQSLHDEVLAIYNAADGSLTRPYQGVAETLISLQTHGIRLGICTNKPENAARHVLQLLGWDQVFDVVIGGDTLAWRKPDPRPLEAVWNAMGRGSALYVGDSEIDAETAAAAGVKFALFTEGYRKKPVDELPHDYVFSNYDALAAIVDDALRGA
ncbi:Phosphoglycolate phosphatase, chromosomal [Shimia sp. SK013]|uniref:phosphoglycolate phosphatase n=1 Tax=Shimia sp. SK013 TaxID=1389006 RepID=UPI0006B52B6A|nr:phosphoglycolate phosphatase [Shimia sp. SK013]KPA22064.1 Phosphoglycolate phosphatase, chromosomal [Shimia sp. SK013]